MSQVTNSMFRVFDSPLEDNSIQSMSYHPTLPNDSSVPALTKKRFEFVHKDVEDDDVEVLTSKIRE